MRISKHQYDQYSTTYLSVHVYTYMYTVQYIIFSTFELPSQPLTRLNTVV